MLDNFCYVFTCKFYDRYNPENMSTLENYVRLQALENTYDLEANLALLKLYQFNPGTYKTDIACLILLKALTNLPNTDFVLCKCLLQQEQVTNCICYFGYSLGLTLSVMVVTWHEHQENISKLISSVHSLF